MSLVAALASLLSPLPRKQIKGPSDAAALLMTEMEHLDLSQTQRVVVRIDSAKVQS